MEIEQEVIEETVEGQEESQEQATVDETPTTGEDGGEEVEKVEEEPEPTSERQVPLEALQDERRKRQEEVRQREELERKMDYLIQQSQQAQRAQQPAPVEPQRPTLEQFEYDEEQYQEALVDYRVNQKIAEREAKVAEQQRVEQQHRYLQDYQSRVARTTQKGEAKYDDFHEVVHNRLPISHVMADVMSQSDIGPDIAYHLGKNPELAQSIAGKPAHLQAAEIGRLEVKLSQKPAKQTTKAPAPIQPVGGGGDHTNYEVDPEKDPDLWIKLRNEGKI